MITIVTISYNQLRYLRLCLESVRAQNYENYEHIIVDPGSTDGSREYLQSLASDRLKLIFEPDSGPADGLNRGIQSMKGDIFMYLNSDDELPPGALRQIDYLHRLYEEEAILGNGWIIDEQSNPLKFVRSDQFSPIRYLMGVGIVLQQATSFKSVVFQRGVRFNTKNRICWDSELHFDIWSRSLRFRNVSQVLGYFRRQPESITLGIQYRKKLAAEHNRLLGEHFPKWLIKLGPALSLAPRLIKRLSSIRARKLMISEFPGLSRDE